MIDYWLVDFQWIVMSQLWISLDGELGLISYCDDGLVLVVN